MADFVDDDNDASAAAAGASEYSKLIEEEYKVWKKNSPFLYDVVLTHALVWPSLTVQWLPEEIKLSSAPGTSEELIQHKLILGTQNDGSEPNYLMIADVLLPSPDAPVDARKYDDDKGEVGGYGGTLSKVVVKVKINHDGDIHRARYMPQNPFIIAVKSPNPDVLVFNYSKHQSNPTDSLCHPNYRCQGHSEGGYGLGWSPITAGHLASASTDGTICIWDIQADSSVVNIPSLHKVSGAHGGHGVEDINWSKITAPIFASVGDDRTLAVWDTRKGLSSAILRSPNRFHTDDINCVSMCPLNEFYVATGSSDCTVKLWDLRKIDDGPWHTLEGHTSGVYQVDWSPFSEYILASSSEDRRVYIWDTDRIGEEQSPEDAEDGPPELLFVHGGHTAKVFDFSWNPNYEWCMASVAEDNVLQIWQMAESIYNEEDEDDGAEELEDEDLEPAAGNADDSGKRKKPKTS